MQVGLQFPCAVNIDYPKPTDDHFMAENSCPTRIIELPVL
jgi:hypothetical protein